MTSCIYLFKVNNRNTRTRCEICSKLTIKTPERRHWVGWSQRLRLESLVLSLYWYTVEFSCSSRSMPNTLPQFPTFIKAEYQRIAKAFTGWKFSKFSFAICHQVFSTIDVCLRSFKVFHV